MKNLPYEKCIKTNQCKPGVSQEKEKEKSNDIRRTK